MWCGCSGDAAEEKGELEAAWAAAATAIICRACSAVAALCWAAAAAAALLLAWPPPPPPPCRPEEEEEEAGEAAGMVAAVQVSVTGQSSLLTRVTPDGVVRMWPGGREGFVFGGALLDGEMGDLRNLSNLMP